MGLFLVLLFALSSIQIIPAWLKRDTEDQNKTELKVFSFSAGDSSSQRRTDDSLSAK